MASLMTAFATPSKKLAENLASPANVSVKLKLRHWSASVSTNGQNNCGATNVNDYSLRLDNEPNTIQALTLEVATCFIAAVEIERMAVIHDLRGAIGSGDR